MLSSESIHIHIEEEEIVWRMLVLRTQSGVPLASVKESELEDIAAPESAKVFSNIRWLPLLIAQGDRTRCVSFEGTT